MKYVVREIKPHRIGHGIAAARDPKLMDRLVEQGITLEVCPTSNLKNAMVKDTRTLRDIIRTLADHGVPMTINTDGPELYDTNVFKEQEFLLKIGAMTRPEITRCNRRAFESSFVGDAQRALTSAKD